MEEGMKFLQWLGLPLLFGLVLLPTAGYSGFGFGRQYYGGWSYSGSYYYRPYYYKPYGDYYGYRTNYCCYYPSSPDYYYYYSPYSHQFWGRCPINTGGEGQYSFLQPVDRPPADPKAGQLPAPGDVAPKANFPAPTTPPAIPSDVKIPEGKKDKEPVQLDLPPDDLPPKVAGAGVPKPEK
jgi:hypothetical protein